MVIFAMSAMQKKIFEIPSQGQFRGRVINFFI